MIEVGFLDVLLFVMLCFIVFELIGYIYYYNKYVLNRPHSEEDKVLRLIWLFLPRFHECSTEEFYFFLKIGFIFLCIISLLYCFLFKIDLPFLGNNPIIIYNDRKTDSFLYDFLNRFKR